MGIEVKKREVEERATLLVNREVRVWQATPEECIKYGIKIQSDQEITGKGEEIMKFAEALDYGIPAAQALVDCDPSRTKDITKERLQLCADAGLAAKEIATGFGTSAPMIYNYCSKHKVKLSGTRWSKKHEAVSPVDDHAAAKTEIHQTLPEEKTPEVISTMGIAAEENPRKEPEKMTAPPLTLGLASSFMIEQLTDREGEIEARLEAMALEMNSLTMESQSVRAAREALERLNALKVS